MNEKPMTLDEFAKRMITPGSTERVVADLLRPSPLVTMLQASQPKPTRWQRFRWPIVTHLHRVKDALAVLRGRATADYD